MRPSRRCCTTLHASKCAPWASLRLCTTAHHGAAIGAPSKSLRLRSLSLAPFRCLRPCQCATCLRSITCRPSGREQRSAELEEGTSSLALCSSSLSLSALRHSRSLLFVTLALCPSPLPIAAARCPHPPLRSESLGSSTPSARASSSHAATYLRRGASSPTRTALPLLRSEGSRGRATVATRFQTGWMGMAWQCSSSLKLTTVIVRGLSRNSSKIIQWTLHSVLVYLRLHARRCLCLCFPYL